MTSHKVKRLPDAAVATAVDQVIKQQKSKRMMLFGLRNLAELCSVGTAKYKENSLDALMRSIVPVLKVCTDSYADDEDVIGLCIRVLCGISEGLLEAGEPETEERFMNEGAPDTVIPILAACSTFSDDSILAYTLSYIANLLKLKLELNKPILSVNLASCLKKKLKPDILTKLLTMLAIFADEADCIDALLKKQASDHILEILLETSPSDAVTPAVEAGFALVLKLSRAAPLTAGQMNNVIKIMDAYKNKKQITEKGSAILVSRLGPDELKRCLKLLAEAAPGSTERQEALVMLASLSYISAYAEAVAKAGGIPTLCNAIKTSLADLGDAAPDVQLVRGLEGACKMLGKIADNAIYADAVVEAGGLHALVSALTVGSKLPTTFAIVCEALTPLVKKTQLAGQLIEEGAFKEVLVAFEKHLKAFDAVAASLTILSAASVQDTIAAELYELNALDVIRKCFEAHIEDAQTQLLTRARDFTEVQDIHQAILKSLNTHGAQSESLSTAALEAFERLLDIPDALEHMSSGETVDAVLNIMLAHQDSAQLQFTGKYILSVIATDDDVIRCLKGLSKAIGGARKTPKETFHFLAAVNGLSQIGRLKPIFEEHKAAYSIQSGIKDWIEGQTFPEQQRIIKAAARSIESLTTGSAAIMDEIVVALLQSCQLPQLKSMIEKQEAQDNSVLDLAKCCKIMCAQRQISPDIIETLIEAVMKVSWKYQEWRKIQIECLEIFKEIATFHNGKGAHLLHEGGALKLVIGHMQKVAIHEDVQIAALSVMAECLKEDVALAEPMKFAGAVEACKQARSTHADSSYVKMLYQQVYPILMPSESSDAEVKNNLKVLDQAMKDRDIKTVINTAKELLELLSSEAACRAAVHNKIGLVLSQAIMVASGSTPEKTLEMCTILSQIMAVVADTRSGAQHLGRCGGLETLNGLLGVLTNAAVPDSEMKRDGIAANLIAQSKLLRMNKAEDISAITKNQIAVFAMLVQDYPEDSRIGGASAQALAIIPGALLTKDPAVAEMLQRLSDGLKSPSENVVIGASTALAELLKHADDSVVELWLDKCGISELFEALDRNQNNRDILNNIIASLNAISQRTNISKLLMKEGGEEARSRAISILVACLESNMDDEFAANAMIDLLNSLTTSQDKPLLTSLGVSELAITVMSRYSDNKQLAAGVGELLGKTGAGEAIESLITQIINTCKERPADWQRSLEALCSKLAATIPATVDDIKKTFNRVPEMCAELSSVISAEQNDAPLLCNVAAVTRRLADRFESDNKSPYGVCAMQSNIIRSLAMALATDNRASQNRLFVIHAYRTLAVSGFNPNTHEQLLNDTNECKLVPIAFQQLNKSQTDADVVARILEFLASASTCQKGIGLITAGCPTQPPAGSSMEEHITTEVLQLLRKHRNHGPATAAGITLIGNLVLQQTKILEGKYFDEIGTIAESTPIGITAFTRVLTKLVENDHAHLIEAEIAKVDDRFHTAYNDKTITLQQKAELAIAYVTNFIFKLMFFEQADFLAAVAASGHPEFVKRPLVLDSLATILEDFKDDHEVFLHAIRALKELSDADGDINAKIARIIPSILFNECAATISSDPVIAKAVLDLLYSLGCNEGNGKLISSVAGFENFKTMIEAESVGFDQEERDEIATLMKSVKAVIEESSPKAQTLKDVYEKWRERKDAGETLEISEAATVMQQFDFVCEYTDEYSKEPLKGLDTELGSEFSYGCKCFSLLHEYPQNIAACIETAEGRMLLKAIQTQKVEEIVQCPIQTAVTLCAHPEGAVHFANLPSVKSVTVDAVNRIKAIKHVTVDEADIMMIPRLELIKGCSIDRDYYNDTDCMLTLVDVWNAYDAGEYSTATLSVVFQAMRKIVNASWVDLIRKHQIPKRLIAVVETGTNTGVLRDVLFLLGALASVPEMKTLIGELRGVEACLELAEKCLRGELGDDSSPVLTNCCLALAKITIGHAPNIAKFVAAKGVATTVQTLFSAAQPELDFDVGNGGSVLMCNLCYRRDDLKEMFGKANGPRAISEAIRKYDGSDSKSAFRCLMSMLMAIGNLALYVPNVNAFLEQEVEKTFAHLYTNSEYLPDELLESSLRTMSNLVLENTDEYMTRFGAVLSPLVTMLKVSPRESTKMLALAFEVIGSLCRLADNAHTFTESGGVEICLRTANTHQDARLCLMVVHVCAVIATHKDLVPRLVEAGVFKFMTNLFNGQVIDEEKVGESAITGLRCVRRMLLNQENAMSFVECDGAESIVNIIKMTASASLVQFEAVLTLTALLTMCPPPEPIMKNNLGSQEPGQSGAEFDWEADVADEGVLGFVHRIDRPVGLRSWQILGLNEEVIRTLVMQLCGAMETESGKKQKKLQLGCLHLLAYFACEKIPAAVEGFYAGQYHNALTNILQNFAKDVAAIKACCITIANVSYVSNAEDYRIVAKDKALLSALSTAVATVPKKPPGNYDFCLVTSKLLHSNDPSPQKFETQTQWDYDLESTGWNATAYPNGVQDLPPDIKSYLREGCRFKLVTDPKTRVPFWWKASQDLTRLQWRMTDDPSASYNHQFAVVRLRAVSQGLATTLLEAASAKDRKIDDKVCLVLIGPANEDAPSGLELNIKTKNKKERDAFWQAMVEWKDAATYGV